MRNKDNQKKRRNVEAIHRSTDSKANEEKAVENLAQKEEVVLKMTTKPTTASGKPISERVVELITKKVMEIFEETKPSELDPENRGGFLVLERAQAKVFWKLWGKKKAEIKAAGFRVQKTNGKWTIYYNPALRAYR